MSGFVFNTVKTIVSAPGSISRLGQLTRERLGSRVLIVTDPWLAKSGLLDAGLETLKAEGLAFEVYSEVQADPSDAFVFAATEKARVMKAEGIIGFGGGSSMDVAKLAALLARSDEKLEQIYGLNLVKGQRLPMILVPTTAGTGSEVTPVAIVSKGGVEKMGVSSPVLLPDVALLDADLTLTVPGPVTAATGIDAMVHAIEAYTSASPNNNPISRALACEALRLLSTNLPLVLKDGKDRAARANMLLGAMLAGQAFANSPVAAVHALAMPLGSVYHLPHGLTNALVLTQVMRFNLPNARQGYTELAPHCFPELSGGSANDRADRFIDALARMSQDSGMPPRQRDAGIKETDLEKLAELAFVQQRLLVNNPRKVELADALAIYREAF